MSEDLALLILEMTKVWNKLLCYCACENDIGLIFIEKIDTNMNH